MADASMTGVIVGGIISLASSLGATVFVDHLKAAREARTLAAAFRGGIGGLLTIVNERKYVFVVKQTIMLGEKGVKIAPLKIAARRDYVELYTKNMDKIGVLHPALAQRIPVFYTCIASLLEDVDSMRAGDWDAMSQQDLVAALKEFHRLLLETIMLGENIQRLVDQKYPPSFWWANLPG